MMDSDSKATTSLFDPNFIDTTPVKIQQFSSVARLYPTLYNPMNGSTPGFPVHHHPQTLLKLMSIESVTPFSHLILCHSLFLLPSIFPSIRVFSKQSVLHIRIMSSHTLLEWMVSFYTFSSILYIYHWV